MKKILIYIAIGLAIGIAFVVQQSRIERLTDERNRYRTNTETLMEDVEQYRTSDSLNAAQVGVLELKLKEFEKYRAADAKLIESLKNKNRDLQEVTTAQSQTIIDLRANVRDSIIYVDRVVTDTLKCFNIYDKWFSLVGCINKAGEFNGTFENRDSLLITETVKYKRCLFWKTKKIKDRKFDIVSKNPYTKITGFEVIRVEN